MLHFIIKKKFYIAFVLTLSLAFLMDSNEWAQAQTANVQTPASFIEVSDSPAYQFKINELSGDRLDGIEGDVVAPVIFFKDEKGQIIHHPIPRSSTENNWDTSSDSASLMTPILTVGFETSQIAAVGLGIVIGTVKDGSEVDWIYQLDFNGVLASAEAGFGGIKARLGYIETSTVTVLFIPIVHAGWALSASVFHGWSDKGLGPVDDVTYAGLEGDIYLSLLRLNAGVFRKLTDDPAVKDYLFNIGIAAYLPLAPFFN